MASPVCQPTRARVPQTHREILQGQTEHPPSLAGFNSYHIASRVLGGKEISYKTLTLLSPFGDDQTRTTDWAAWVGARRALTCNCRGCLHVAVSGRHFSNTEPAAEKIMNRSLVTFGILTVLAVGISAQSRAAEQPAGAASSSAAALDDAT